jgi:hypothetical protein
MKYIKRFNEQTEKSIEDWCKDFDIKKYRYKIKNGRVDVKGNVNISEKNLSKIPIQFGVVTGYFTCVYNLLISLIGAPVKVGGGFYCSNNQLTSLSESPVSVGDIFDCPNNQLTSLEGATEKINGNFYCPYNKLETLEGGPKEVDGNYYCHKNELISLEGAPSSLSGEFTCSNNPIYEVYILFRIPSLLFDDDHDTYVRYQASLDYNYLRGTNIVRGRFEKACEDAEIKMPDSIKGYKYI